MRSPRSSRLANTSSRSTTCPPSTTSIWRRGALGSTWPPRSRARVRRRPSSCSRSRRRTSTSATHTRPG
jgi:hypothetical protein